MTRKVPIHTHQVHQIPKQSSWLDQRLVRDRYTQLIAA